MTSNADDAFSASDIRNANKMKETLMTSKAVDAFSASDIRKAGASRALLSWWLDATKPPQEMKPDLMERKVQMEQDLVERKGKQMNELFEGAFKPLDPGAGHRGPGDGSDLTELASLEREEPRHVSTTGRTDG